MRLYPAARIAIGPQSDLRTAAVTCLLATEPGAPATFLVTAGHLFVRHADGDDAQVWGIPGVHDPPVPIGRLHTNLLDQDTGVDAALVRLDEPVHADTRPGAGWFSSVVRAPDQGALRAIAWLPSKRGCARVSWLSAGDRPLAFRSPIRHDGYAVGAPLVTHPCQSRQGDSGAPVLTAAEPRSGVAMLVGRHGSSAVYQRLSDALAALSEAAAHPLLLVCAVNRR